MGIEYLQQPGYPKDYEPTMALLALVEAVIHPRHASTSAIQSELIVTFEDWQKLYTEITRAQFAHYSGDCQALAIHHSAAFEALEKTGLSAIGELVLGDRKRIEDFAFKTEFEGRVERVEDEQRGVIIFKVLDYP